MGKIKVFVYTFPTALEHQHSYVVGTTQVHLRCGKDLMGQGGLSAKLGRIDIDEETTTFVEARRLIEIFEDRGMTRYVHGQHPSRR